MPTYNESENLESVVLAVLKGGHDVLVVDDNSVDGTGDLANQLASNDMRVQVLHRSHKLGLGSAYVAGFRLALEQGYRFILEMDADGSHQPGDLDRLIHAARSSNGVSIGSRYVPGGGAIGWSLERRILSRAANLYCRLLLGSVLCDWTSGFRCYSSTVLKDIGLDDVQSDGFAFQIELAYRCLQRGIPIVEVPIYFRERTLGQSKASATEVRKALNTVSSLRFRTSRHLAAGSLRGRRQQQSDKRAG